MKKLLILIIALAVGLMVGCSTEESKDVKPKAPKTEDVVKAEPVSVAQTKEEDLKAVGKDLVKKYDKLDLAKTEQEYDKTRKEMFVDFDFYAPMSDFQAGKYTDVKSTITNEKITKGEGIFYYEIDLALEKTLANGQKETKQGHITFDIVPAEDGSYKITVVR